jgi:hypothetical protein
VIFGRRNVVERNVKAENQVVGSFDVGTGLRGVNERVAGFTALVGALAHENKRAGGLKMIIRFALRDLLHLGKNLIFNLFDDDILVLAFFGLVAALHLDRSQKRQRVHPLFFRSRVDRLEEQFLRAVKIALHHRDHGQFIICAVCVSRHFRGLFEIFQSLGIVPVH